MKEWTAVIMMVITKGSSKCMIMAGIMPKNITRQYSKESCVNPYNTRATKA